MRSGPTMQPQVLDGLQPVMHMCFAGDFSLDLEVKMGYISISPMCHSGQLDCWIRLTQIRG